jgi:hypothetical protein
VVERGAPLPEGLALQVSVVRPVERPPDEPLVAHNVDNELWRRTWVLPDRLVVEYPDVVLLEVTLTDLTVTFDRPLKPDVEQHLLLDHVLPLLLTLRGQVVLHGAMVHLDGRAIVLVGSSGAGKSTLTAFAWQQGWTVGGDDGAVLHLGSPVTCEPTYPTIRLTAQSTALLGIAPDAGGRVANKLRVTGRGQQRFDPATRSLALVAEVVPVPADEAAGLLRLRGARTHAALFGYAFHLQLGEGALLRRSVDMLAEVADVVPVARLRVPRGLPGLAAAEALLRDHLRRGPS